MRLQSPLKGKIGRYQDDACREDGTDGGGIYGARLTADLIHPSNQTFLTSYIWASMVSNAENP